MDFSANKQDTYEKRIASLPDQPNMQPLNNIAKNIVYSGSKMNVKMTMIDGQILYYEGKYLCCDDPEKLYAKANEIIHRLAAEA